MNYEVIGRAKSKTMQIDSAPLCRSLIHYFSYSLSSDFKDRFFNQAKQRSAVADNDSPLHL